jgi:hypothetical protein
MSLKKHDEPAVPPAIDEERVSQCLDFGRSRAKTKALLNLLYIEA